MQTAVKDRLLRHNPCALGGHVHTSFLEGQRFNVWGTIKISLGLLGQDAKSFTLAIFFPTPGPLHMTPPPSSWKALCTTLHMTGSSFSFESQLSAYAYALTSSANVALLVTCHLSLLWFFL